MEYEIEKEKYMREFSIDGRSGRCTFICPNCGQLFECQDIKQNIKVGICSDSIGIDIRPSAKKIEDCIKVNCTECYVDMVCAPTCMTEILMNSYRAGMIIEDFNIGNPWRYGYGRHPENLAMISVTMPADVREAFSKAMEKTCDELVVDANVLPARQQRAGRTNILVETDRSDSQAGLNIRLTVCKSDTESIEATIADFDRFWEMIKKTLRMIVDEPIVID